jgi:hypothetical protein
MFLFHLGVCEYRQLKIQNENKRKEKKGKKGKKHNQIKGNFICSAESTTLGWYTIYFHIPITKYITF